MVDNWSNLILNRLVDKYERTSAFREGTEPNKRIILNFYGQSRTDFTEYDIENNYIRTSINETVIKLAKEKLIFYEWMRGQTDHILLRVWLNFEKTDEVYKSIGRKSKREIINTVCDELTAEIENISTEWIVSYYSETIEYLKSHMSFGNRISSEKSERYNLYRVLKFINDNTGLIVPERVFSEKCFGDSKYFEMHIKSTLLSVMRKHIGAELSDSELLNYIGIAKYPEQLEMAGKILINSNDMSIFKSGFCIYSKDIDSITLSIDNTVTRIITIEN